MADRLLATDNIHNLFWPAGERISERTVSCRLAFTPKKDSGFGLEDGDKVVRHEVQLILVSLLGREFAFVAFVREPGDARLRFGIGLQGEKFLRGFRVEGGANGFENPIQVQAVSIFLHLGMIPQIHAK